METTQDGLGVILALTLQVLNNKGWIGTVRWRVLTHRCKEDEDAGQATALR